ncbi:MAG: RNA polymerase sigma factor [Acidobacteriia bacterium]|nr:RNA polymerase sigma factor [Terriglobia bacterium]
MTVPETDAELLVRSRQGDESAFLLLYRRLESPLYRFALNMTGSPASAEDITQEAFLALLREDCGYQPERGTLSAYLFGIARKLVLRHQDRNRPYVELELGDTEWQYPERAAGPDPMREILEREALELLRRAVVSLPRRYREVVVLCDLQEIDYAEAADLLGCPVGTVRSRLHRARALLLEKLQPRREPRPDPNTWNTARSLI